MAPYRELESSYWDASFPLASASAFIPELASASDHPFDSALLLGLAPQIELPNGLNADKPL